MTQQAIFLALRHESEHLEGPRARFQHPTQPGLFTGRFGVNNACFKPNCSKFSPLHRRNIQDKRRGRASCSQKGTFTEAKSRNHVVSGLGAAHDTPRDVFASAADFLRRFDLKIKMRFHKCTVSLSEKNLLIRSFDIIKT